MPIDDAKNRFHWDENMQNKDDKKSKLNNDTQLKYPENQSDFKNKIVKFFDSENSSRLVPVARKNTVIDLIPTSLKQTSPLNFPKFSNAFKPFKKRAKSFHHLTQIEGITMIDTNGKEHNKKKS